MWMFTGASCWACCSWGGKAHPVPPAPRLGQIECPSQQLVPHGIDDSPHLVNPQNPLWHHRDLQFLHHEGGHIRRKGKTQVVPWYHRLFQRANGLATPAPGIDVGHLGMIGISPRPGTLAFSSQRIWR